MTNPGRTRTAPTRQRLTALVDDFAGLRVAVFGDLIADEFIYGESRASRARRRC